MAIPKYNEMYGVFLECLADGLPKHMDDIRNYCAQKMHVTEDERRQMLPSGKQALFDNRVSWTRTYLYKAGLIEKEQRSIWKISLEGKRVFMEQRYEITDAYLMRYDSFRLFKTPGYDGKSSSEASQWPLENTQKLIEQNNKMNGSDSPQDQLESAFIDINKKLQSELLEEVLRQNPLFFEYTVVHLLERMGYGGFAEGSGEVTGRSGDEGIDGIIQEDKLGFSSIYIQAKRWDPDQTVGRPEIQKFVGALAGQGATKGLFITTSRFSSEAKEYVKKQHTVKVVLVDGEKLAQLMIEHDVGVTTQEIYTTKSIDMDFFSRESD